jgi:hypothetical protein
MASGPQNYREAESRLLMAWEDGRRPEDVAHLVAEAQVHATLALAAATVMHAVTQGDLAGYSGIEYDQWLTAMKTEADR